MAAPTLLPGNRFRLNRETATPGTYAFVCIATTVALDRGADFEDTTVPDCATPLSIPNRQSTIRSRHWGISFSGMTDAKKFEDMETDFNADVTHNYQIITDLAGASGGKTYTGAAWIETLNMTKTNNGMVAFTATLRGDGPLTTTALA